MATRKSAATSASEQSRPRAVKKQAVKKQGAGKQAAKEVSKRSTSMPKKGRDPKGGLTAEGRAFFAKKEGAHLRPGVQGPADTPEKMVRKGSFLRRHFAHPRGPMKDAKGEPTRLALSAHAWGEPVPKTMADARRLAALGHRLLEEYHQIQEESASPKRKAAAKKGAAKKAAGKKVAGKKVAGKKAAPAERATKAMGKTTAKRSAGRKSAASKTTAKKTASSRGSAAGRAKA